MTEAATTPIESTIVDAIQKEEKLLAGKYRSVEELEEAYKNSAKVYNENIELKKRLDGYTVTPGDYTLPEGLNLNEGHIRDLKDMAKQAGLNQDHFVKMATELDGRLKHNLQIFEDTKKSLGDDKINVLNDYVKKYYPEKLQDHVLTKLIKDKDAMSEAMEHRDKMLNSKVPGIERGNTVAPEKYDGQKELENAHREYERNPNEKSRNKYIKVAEEVANERFK